MTSEKSPFLPAAAVRLAAAWILVGALFKLLLGTPADLPEIVREVPFSDGLVYRSVIAVELALALLAFTRPRLAWVPVGLLYVLFEVILATQIAEGADSCGCLGSKVTLTPWQMAGIDTALLVLMLVARPWRITSRGLPFRLLVPGILVVALLPWIFDREVTELPPDGGNSARPLYFPLDIDEWVGQTIYDSPLADLIEEDIGTLPPEGLWVLWRWTCDHCAEHLEEMVRTPPDAMFITLVRVREKHDSEENRAVFFMPEGAHVMHVNLPDSVEYVISTPAELWIEDGVIVSAEEIQLKDH